MSDHEILLLILHSSYLHIVKEESILIKKDKDKFKEALELILKNMESSMQEKLEKWDLITQKKPSNNMRFIVWE